MTGNDDRQFHTDGAGDRRQRVVGVLTVVWFLATAGYYYQSLGYLDLLRALLGWGQP